MAGAVFARLTSRSLTLTCADCRRYSTSIRPAPNLNASLTNAPLCKPNFSFASDLKRLTQLQPPRSVAYKKPRFRITKHPQRHQHARQITKPLAYTVSGTPTQKFLETPRWCKSYAAPQYLRLDDPPGRWQHEVQPTQTRMKCNVEVLTTPTADTPGTSLLLQFPDKRYLIGHVHEGCQRAIVERGKKLVKVTDLFLTGNIEWRNTGGLLGLLITAADSKAAAKQAFIEDKEAKNKRRIEIRERELREAGPGSKRQEKMKNLLEAEKARQAEQRAQDMATGAPETMPSLSIHGGRNILHTVATSRRFIFRRGLPLHVYETMADAGFDAEKPTWSDANIQVFAMPTTPNGTPDSQKISPEDSSALQSVVHNMFDSDWKMDALFETKLADVKMPAAIFVRDSETHKIEKWVGPKPGDVDQNDLPDIKVLVRKPWPAALVTKLPETSPSPVSMSYFIKSHPQRGRFLPEKAKALGVEPRDFKILTAGDSLNMPDGTVVKPEQVLEPTRPGKGFAVVDIPSHAHIKPTIDRPEWKCDDLMRSMEGIFWILGPNVLRSREFIEFVNRLPGMQHVISAPESSSNYLAFKSASTLQMQLAHVSQKHHPVLDFNDQAAALPSELVHCVKAHPGQMLDIEPEAKWDVSEAEPLLNCAEVIRRMPGKVRSLAAAANRDVSSAVVQEQIAAQQFPGANAEIITLGTGSAMPSKYRNVSATLLRVPGYGSYLFDAGENTMGQLSRIYKPDELREVLQDLRMIWISHMHADHHLGTTSVIRAWHEAKHGAKTVPQTNQARPDAADVNANPAQYLNQSKLVVASDSKMLDWLWEYSAAEYFGLSEVVPLSVNVTEAKNTHLYYFGSRLVFEGQNREVSQALKDMTCLVDLQAAPVDHCNGAKAVAITFADGFKVSYSGDCRPSKRFIEVGKGSTLLIHEATFDDELIGDAVAKKHSTVSEAIRVGIEMGAPRIMLTHFSQRYAKLVSVNNVQKYEVMFQDTNGTASDDIAIEHSVNTALEPGSASSNARLGRMLAKSASVESLSAEVGTKVDVKVGAALDYMRVKVKDIAVLEKFHEATSLLMETEAFLPTEIDEGDEHPKKRKSDDELQKPKRDKSKKDKAKGHS